MFIGDFIGGLFMKTLFYAKLIVGIGLYNEIAFKTSKQKKSIFGRNCLDTKITDCLFRQNNFEL